VVRLGKVWCGWVRRGRCGMVRSSQVRCGMAGTLRSGLVRSDMVRWGLAGQVWFGVAEFGSAWQVRSGWAGRGLVGPSPVWYGRLN